jgi:hypothetical protein
VRAEAPPSTLSAADAEALYRLYAVLVLVTGERTEAADVHHVWAAWKAERDPEDEDIVPFEVLDEPTKAADEPFAAAIRKVAGGLSANQLP